MLANVMLQAFDAVVADHEPQLQRAEAASQLNVPVAVVDDCSRFGGLIPQVFRQDAQGLNQRLAVGDPEAVAVEVGEHPFMRIEVVAVGEFDAALQVAEFRAEHGGARHGRVHMQPQIVLAADFADRGDRVHGVGRSRAHRGAHHARSQSGAAVRVDLARQGVRAHGEILVDFDEPQVLYADARDHGSLLQRGMGLRRDVGDEPSIASFLVADIVGGALACGQQGAERSARSGILNNAAAGVRRQEFFGQAEHGDQPVHDVRFEFGAGGAGRPQHPLHAQAGGKKIAQNSGP